MKKIASYIVLFFAVIATAFAQDRKAPKEIWTYPAAFTADEEVTIYMDVTGTDLDGNAGPLYVWSWTPADPGNGSWDNSAEKMKCTKVEGNIWSITFVPTEFYGKTKDEIIKIEGLLKTKDGSAQTGNFDEVSGNALFLYDFNLMKNQTGAVYPSEFSADRPLTILLNVANAFSDGGGEKGQLVGKQPSMHGGINGWQSVVESGNEKTFLKEVGENVWKLDIFPDQYYGIDKATKISEINSVFNNAGDWAASARDKGGVDFTFKPQKAGEVAKVESRFFPQQLTPSDILMVYFDQTVTQVEGLKTTSELFYTIRANGGQFSADGKAQNLGNGEFRAILIPDMIFAGKDIQSLEIIFKNADGSVSAPALAIDGLFR